MIRDFSKDRDAFIWGIIGDNGSGKSVTAMEFARAWKKSRPLGTVIVHDPKNEFDSISDFTVSANDKDWAQLVARKKDVLFLIDELRVLHKNPQADKGLHELMAMRRDNNIDIIYIVHNPKLVLEIFTNFTHIYFIFYTNSKEGGFESKIPNYKLAHRASLMINKYVNLTGDGTYPNFPYIVVDNKSKELFAVNIDEDTLMG